MALYVLTFPLWEVAIKKNPLPRPKFLDLTRHYATIQGGRPEGEPAGSSEFFGSS